MSDASILYELNDQVAFVRLNEPETLNALSANMGPALLEAIARAQQEARCLVIGSVGRGFCSGANLTDGDLDLSDADRDLGAGVETVINPMMEAIRASPIPVIIAVRGPAAGVGCGLALMGDLIVAGESAVFHLAFSRVGLSPDGGVSYQLVRTLGRVRATELMLLGGRISAVEAHGWGLVSRVVADVDVDAVALELAGRLAIGPRSLGMIREAAWAALDAPFTAQLATERRLQCEAGRTADFVEGVAAFGAKRAAVFSGR
jgi:2-(1,2-epoxy-1,2-dihydrophenyl)acetyl-CoA isomerase